MADPKTLKGSVNFKDTVQAPGTDEEATQEVFARALQQLIDNDVALHSMGGTGGGGGGVDYVFGPGRAGLAPAAEFIIDTTKFLRSDAVFAAPIPGGNAGEIAVCTGTDRFAPFVGIIITGSRGNWDIAAEDLGVSRQVLSYDRETISGGRSTLELGGPAIDDLSLYAKRTFVQGALALCNHHNDYSIPANVPSYDAPGWRDSMVARLAPRPGGSTINGFKGGGVGANGQFKIVFNVSTTDTLTIPHNGLAQLSVDTVHWQDGTDAVIGPAEGFLLVYDYGSQYWRAFKLGTPLAKIWNLAEVLAAGYTAPQLQMFAEDSATNGKNGGLVNIGAGAGLGDGAGGNAALAAGNGGATGIAGNVRLIPGYAKAGAEPVERGWIDADDCRVSNLADPRHDEDATNKQWVESLFSSSSWRSVRTGVPLFTAQNGKWVVLVWEGGATVKLPVPKTGDEFVIKDERGNAEEAPIRIEVTGVYDSNGDPISITLDSPFQAVHLIYSAEAGAFTLASDFSLDAPANARYLVAASTNKLSAECVVQNTNEIEWDLAGGHARASVIDGSITTAKITIDEDLEFYSNRALLRFRPTAPEHGTNKAYVDAEVKKARALLAGIDSKASCLLCLETNMPGTSLGDEPSGLAPLDGITLYLPATATRKGWSLAGSRILLTGQDDPRQNGFWLCQSAAWTRPDDFPINGNAAGVSCFIERGTYADTGWECTNDAGKDIIGHDALVFRQFTLGENGFSNVITPTPVTSNTPGSEEVVWGDVPPHIGDDFDWSPPGFANCNVVRLSVNGGGGDANILRLINLRPAPLSWKQVLLINIGTQGLRLHPTNFLAPRPAFFLAAKGCALIQWDPLVAKWRVVAASSTPAIGEIPWNELAPVATDRLIGRGSETVGPMEELAVSGGLQITPGYLSIVDHGVTLQKLETIGGGSIIGRAPGLPGTPMELKVGNGFAITEGANDWYLHRAAFVGDVTASVDSNTLTISNGVINNANFIDSPANTFKGRGATSGPPEDLTAADVAAVLPVFTSAAKGVAPASGGGTSKFLRADGIWASFDASLTPTGTISNDKLALVAQFTIKGRVGAGTGAPEDLTAAQATGILDLFTTASKGLAPASGGGTLNFLRADGSWAAPSGTFAIADGTIGNAKLATVATATFKGRSSAGTGAPEDMNATVATSLLNAFAGSLKGLVPASGGGTVNFLRADGSWAVAVADGGVTNIKLANVNSATFKGRVTAGAGVPEDLTPTQATALLDPFSSGLKGLAPASGGGTLNFLRADGSWAAPSGTFALADGAVSNMKLGIVATATFKGRVSAGTGVPEDLTGSQATGLLDVVTSTLKGLAPASGGGTSNYLRADGTWAAPPGTFSIVDNTIANSKLLVVNSRTFKGRISANAGAPEDMTAAEATTLLDGFTSGTKGLAPASGGGTVNFLRADGMWQPPPSGIATNDSRLSDDRVASGLRSTTGVVDTASAAAPSAGKFFAATDATHGTWRWLGGATVVDSTGRAEVLAPFPTHHDARQTTDATVTTALTLSLADNSIISVGFRWLARQVAGTATLFRESTAFFKRVAGGGATLVGYINDGVFDRTDIGWSANVVTSGNDVLVQITGKAAVTINWEVEAWVQTRALP